MMMLGVAVMTLATPADAAVVASDAHGFMLQTRVEIDADAATVYTTLVQPSRWWSSSHSYSGDARNMTLDARAGGCFCEAVPMKLGQAGSVEHGRVVYAMPDHQLRLSTALGPLQAEGVSGALDLMIVPRDKGVTVTMTYVVGGYVRTGAAAMAPVVDQVLAEQLNRLKRAAESAVE